MSDDDITGAQIIANIIMGRTLSSYDDVRLWPEGPMRHGMCLDNALRMVEHGYTPVVGYVILDEGVRLEHAWVVDADGVGWEVTMDINARVWAEIKPRYEGVPFRH